MGDEMPHEYCKKIFFNLNGLALNLIGLFHQKPYIDYSKLSTNFIYFIVPTFKGKFQK